MPLSLFLLSAVLPARASAPTADAVLGGLGDALAGCALPAEAALSAEVTIAAGEVVAVRQVAPGEGLDASARACALGVLFSARLDEAATGTVEVSLWSPPTPPPFSEADAAAIQRVVHHNAGQIRSCYEQSLRLAPSLSGALTMKMQLEAGRVAGVAFEGSASGDEALRSCITRRAVAWRFPEGASGEVLLPLNLSPSG